MRKIQSGGYSSHQYNAVELREKAQLVADAIPGLLRKYNANAIVVTGKSGHSVAFAALMLVDYPLVVVRKETDQSHGSRIEGRDGILVSQYLILDDFICSGTTVDKVVATMDAQCTDVKCVGVVTYTKLGDKCQDMYYVDAYEYDIPVVQLAYRS